MALFYSDTSALAKRYVWEDGSPWIKSLVDPSAGHDLYVARITEVELTSAIARRRGRPGMSRPQSATALDQFRIHLAKEYRMVEISIPIIQRAAFLADRHALRGYDAVQLAVAMDVARLYPTLVLISADLELNVAAVAEGLTTKNPNDYP